MSTYLLNYNLTHQNITQNLTIHTYIGCKYIMATNVDDQVDEVIITKVSQSVQLDKVTDRNRLFISNGLRLIQLVLETDTKQCIS